MTKQRFSSTMQVLVTAVIFLFVATGDSFAQPVTKPITGTVDIKNEGQVLSKVADIITPGAAYFIKSKESQKVMDVAGGSDQPGAVIRQLALNGKFEQKFVFTNAGGGFFFIRSSTGGHFLTLHNQPKPFLTQELLSSNPQTADSQKWNVVESVERDCFIILNKTDSTLALQPTTDSGRLTMATHVGNNLQKWILKITTVEPNPDAATAENGLVAKCDATLTAFRLITSKINVSPIFPEWRSVGEDFVVDGVRKPPLRSYKILEGVVARDGAHVSSQDAPAAHFTHDFIFHVNPDPAFRYLLAKPAPRQNLPDFVQNDVEVEWESGLAQADDRKRNPASAASIRGDSFGFYTAGHKLRDPIWNWPTNNDWVHVEGIWIFDRGHEPARTEIHPPHFVAVKRDLPDKFEPRQAQPGQFVFATRADIFANGDGNIVWNNKKLHDFAQPVKMSERVYTVIFKHDLPRPTPTAKLKFEFERQKGDTYTGRPIVEVFEKGTADVPTPHVMMTISWAGDRVPDTAVFAKTLYIYWDDLPTHGVPASFPIKEVKVTLENIVIQDKSEGDDVDAGEYRLFADIGGRWIFLNEFTGATDIMKEGLGRAWDDTFSQRHPIGLGSPFPRPPGAEFDFSFRQTFFVYLPPRKSFRVSVGGWEGDYIEDQFGKILNPYSTCAQAKRFVEDEFDGSDFVNHGRLDDTVGETTRVFTFNAVANGSHSIQSKGEITNFPGDKENNPNKNFRANFSVRVSRP
ncbi:MAG: RICIN domain-containing protein [Pyrinomonadaceae bacterium]